jgi:hypothetical protein
VGVAGRAQYGYGLQVGAFCNGDALMMGCKTAEGVHVALLSLFYLDECAVPEVKLATASWVRNGAGAAEAYTLQQGEARSEARLDLAESLFVLRRYTPYAGEGALLAAVLDAVRSPTGTLQEVYHLHATSDGAPLLRFDVPGDVVLRPGVSKTHTNLPAEQAPPALDTSLRAYLEVLYLQPRLRITLRGVPVAHRLLVAGLFQLQEAVPYAPRGMGVTVSLTLGVAVEDDDDGQADAGGRLSRRGGVALYWQGRLIRYCEPLGMQRSSGALGAGVCGVADVGGLLTPLPTKQAFEQDEHHMRLLKELGDRLNAYTNTLVTSGVLDPDLQRRRLTDAAAAALAAVRAKQKLDAALAADPRRTLSCADCFKHRFVSDDVSDAAFEALDAAVWRCSMHPDAAAAAAGCSAEQEAPSEAPPEAAAPLIRTDKPLPEWLLAHGDATVGWRMVHVSRGRVTHGCSYAIYYYSPAGHVFPSSRRRVEEFLAAGGDYAACRLTDAAPAAAGRARAKKRGGKARSDDDSDDEPPPAKRPRGRSAIQELAIVQKEKAKANRELAAQERRIQRDKELLAAEKAAFARAREAETKRRDAEARRSARHAGAARPPSARGARMCRCQRTVAECAAQLTVACDECGAEFHAECLGLAHDVAAGMDFACADHGEAAVEARKAAALLLPHPRAARRWPNRDPAPSPSGSMFQLFPDADGAAEDDAASSGAGTGGLPANWPRSAGSPAFLTHNVHGAWPSPEAWALLHATHEQAPLPGVAIRTLPLSHKLAKAALGAKGSKPRGLFATRGFPEGAVIGEYVGHVRHASSMDGAAQYLFELSSVATPAGRTVLIDAGPCGNETRFINWHRGLAPAPNCRFEEARVLRTGGSCEELVVRVLTARRILRDEELLIDYGGLYTLPGEQPRAQEGLLGDGDDDDGDE